MLKVRNLRRGAGGEHMAHGCLKVHGGVPIVLYIFSDPLEPRINCLVIRE